jgi:hypothetical protein
MIETFQAIIGGSLERLSYQARTGLPPLIAAVTILLVAWIVAVLARKLVNRIFKGIELDMWLRRTGVTAMIDRSGRLRTSYIASQVAFWGILMVGLVAAVNVFGSDIATQTAATLALLVPRLVIAVLILVAGLWLGQYLGRTMLVWAVNEDLPSPRKLAMLVRFLVMITAVVAAADTVNFAPGVFLAAFVLILGGVVLAGSLALGLGSRDAVRRHLEDRESGRSSERFAEKSLWDHL